MLHEHNLLFSKLVNASCCIKEIEHGCNSTGYKAGVDPWHGCNNVAMFARDGHSRGGRTQLGGPLSADGGKVLGKQSIFIDRDRFDHSLVVISDTGGHPSQRVKHQLRQTLVLLIMGPFLHTCRCLTFRRSGGCWMRMRCGTQRPFRSRCCSTALFTRMWTGSWCA